MQRILRESIAVQSLSARVERLRSNYQSETFQREEAFRAADLELARKRTELTPEEFARERRRLEQQAGELQRDSQERKKEIDQIFAQGMAQVQNVLLRVSQDVATERNLDLVLAKATVMLVRPDLEITNQALERLNKELPDVALVQPEGNTSENTEE